MVDFDRRASQRRDGVDKEEGVMFAAEGGDLLERLPDTGRSFGMHDGHGFHRPGSTSCLLDDRRFYGLSPWGFHGNDFSAATFDDSGPSCAKYAVDSHDDRIARLNDIHDRRLHRSE